MTLGLPESSKKKRETCYSGFGGKLMGMPGPWELILILLIVVLIFGAKRIPEIMGGIGKGIRTFKKTMDGEDEPSSAPSASPQVETPEKPKEEKAESK
jgi:sec-independent protein translocase protein TatA